jgi:hypothetical protein
MNSRRAVCGHHQRVELLGSEGLLSATNILENTVSKPTKDGVVSAKPEYFFLERYMKTYAILRARPKPLRAGLTDPNPFGSRLMVSRCGYECLHRAAPTTQSLSGG